MGRVIVKLTSAFLCVVSLIALVTARLSGQAYHAEVWPLPRPNGAFGVGTSVVYVIDSSRVDAEFTTGRPITVQLWYPAAGTRGTVAPYLLEPSLGRVLLRDMYYGMDSTTLRAWQQLRTHSRLDAPVRRGSFPIVAFSVGQGVIRANYTSLCEELASRGYIVALVDSPLQGMMVRPDGRVVSDTAGVYGEPGPHVRGVAAWSRDISFTFDLLMRRTLLAPVAGAIDWKRVGAMGHSSGGVVAVATCQSDQRVTACINMDGGVASPDGKPMAEFVTRGVEKPVLFLRSQPIYDDSTLKRRGMTREQWAKRGEGGKAGFDSLVARSSAQITVAFVAGTGHFSFSDAPFVMPTAITRFGGRIIAPRRGLEVITAAVRGYLDDRFAGKGGRLSAAARRYPELTLAGRTAP